MTSPSIVRRAIPEDSQQIWELFWALHEENGLFDVSSRKVGFLIERCLHPEKIPPDDVGLRGIIGVIGPPGGKLEGLIVLIFGTYWYSEDVCLEELCNFVHPDYRSSHHADVLIEYAKMLSDKLGLKLIIGIMSNKRTEAKVRLYKRKLGQQAGAFFIVGGKTGVGNGSARSAMTP